jgi:hypothetical protein
MTDTSEAARQAHVPPPEPDDDQPGDEEVAVPVRITFTETCTYELNTTVSVPGDLAANWLALKEAITEDEDLWFDGLDAAQFLGVHERDVLAVQRLKAIPPAASGH